MGGFLAKLSVSALMFDYILTGPISGVSAGQYIIGLLLDTLARMSAVQIDLEADAACHPPLGLGGHRLRHHALLLPPEPAGHSRIERQGAEDHDRHHRHGGRDARLVRRDAGRARPGQRPCPSWQPDLRKGRSDESIADGTKSCPKINPITGEQEDPLGFLGQISRSWPSRFASPTNWLSLIGVIGMLIAFGHSILAMSGEETLAQVYREVESPKLPNFKKAAFIVFLYSLLLTGTHSFLPCC